MDPGAPVSRLVEEQLIAFRENFGASEIARARALHVTPYQLLIVASMVEREAQIPGDRPKIAAVIYNRLAQGMPLGIDASIYYAVELADGHRHLHPRTHRSAAAHRLARTTRAPTSGCRRRRSPTPAWPRSKPPPTPRTSSYLYYVAGADGCGEQVFSEHARRIRSQRRRLQGGGRAQRRAPADLQAP